jgi:hypothetical protein
MVSGMPGQQTMVNVAFAPLTIVIGDFLSIPVAMGPD